VAKTAKTSITAAHTVSSMKHIENQQEELVHQCRELFLGWWTMIS
jgi:hypothetical protein